MNHTFLALPLPEEIRRLKEAGRLKEADSGLSEDSDMVFARLKDEIHA